MKQSLILALLMSVLPACTEIVTKYPIGVSADPQQDTRLLGGWRVVRWGDEAEPPGWQMSPADSPSYLFVEPNGEGILRATFIGPTTIAGHQQADGARLFRIVIGRIGTHGVLNAQARWIHDWVVDPERTSSRYFPLLYQFGPEGTLRLFSPGEFAVNKEIEQGRLGADKDPGGGFGDAAILQINSDRQTLDRVFADDAPALFTHLLATLEPIDRRNTDTRVPIEKLRGTLGTVAAFSLGSAPIVIINRSDGEVGPLGVITEDAARAMEGALRNLVRAQDLPTGLREQIVTRAPMLAGARIIDGGAGSAKRSDPDYKKLARHGVQTVLELGHVYVLIRFNCHDKACSNDEQIVSTSIGSDARLVRVSDQKVLWVTESSLRCCKDSKYSELVAKDGELIRSTMLKNNAVQVSADEILKRIYVATNPITHTTSLMSH